MDKRLWGFFVLGVHGSAECGPATQWPCKVECSDTGSDVDKISSIWRTEIIEFYLEETPRMVTFIVIKSGMGIASTWRVENGEFAFNRDGISR